MKSRTAAFAPETPAREARHGPADDPRTLGHRRAGAPPPGLLREQGSPGPLCAPLLGRRLGTGAGAEARAGGGGHRPGRPGGDPLREPRGVGARRPRRARQRRRRRADLSDAAARDDRLHPQGLPTDGPLPLHPRAGGEDRGHPRRAAFHRAHLLFRAGAAARLGHLRGTSRAGPSPAAGAGRRSGTGGRRAAGSREHHLHVGHDGPAEGGHALARQLRVERAGGRRPACPCTRRTAASPSCRSRTCWSGWPATTSCCTPASGSRTRRPWTRSRRTCWRCGRRSW